MFESVRSKRRDGRRSRGSGSSKECRGNIFNTIGRSRDGKSKNVSIFA